MPCWQNSTVLKGEATQSVSELKASVDDDLMIMGSGGLVRSLIGRGLVDEFVLLVHPLILGSGQRLFPNDDSVRTLDLVGTESTSTGVIITTYHEGTKGDHMQCGHDGCLCITDGEQAYCGDHCRKHAATGPAYDPYPCGCGHEACQAAGR